MRQHRSTLRWFGYGFLLASVAAVPATAAAQRHCSPSLIPAELPSVDAIVDSAAIVEILAGSGAEGVLRFSIVADVGESPRVFPHGASSSATEWLTPRIQSALRDAPKPIVAWGVRLAAAAGPSPALTLERSEYCRPQAIPGSASRATIRVVTEPGSPRTPRVSLRPIVRVSALGDVRDVTFEQPLNRDLESELRRVMMGTRYHPARIDGVPVASVDSTSRR